MKAEYFKCWDNYTSLESMYTYYKVTDGEYYMYRPVWDYWVGLTHNGLGIWDHIEEITLEQIIMEHIK